VRQAAEGQQELLTDYATAFSEEVGAATSGYDFLLRGHELVARLQQRLANAFESYDYLILPTLAFPAPLAGETYLEQGPTVAGRVQPDRWIVGTTIQFNLASMCPAISVPMGHALSGVPVGLQIIGRPYADRAVLNLAARYEIARGPLTFPSMQDPRLGAESSHDGAVAN
jgi:aspartyl-tRNA(Asn)/glutamyl-tRNA(Gln) amidotransferase subunit A